MINHQPFDIASLGYLLVAADRLDAWKEFAGPNLGMQVIDKSSNTVAFRMDDRAQRLIITDSPQTTRYTIGWQASSVEALDRIGARLEGAGVAVTREPRSTSDERMVGELISCHDPAGNRIEVFCDPLLVDTSFIPGRAHSGFRTGSLGFGHVVLTSPSLDQQISFYRDLLGFRVSDYQLSPFHAYFFHINHRHHSLALIEQDKVGIHHVMIEHTMFDDVGQGYDAVRSNGHDIVVTLGRHSNDLMTSFYVRSPSQFMFEIGWGGLELDPTNWKPMELTNGPSLWGHDRSWMTPEQFAEADRLRLEAAARGMRAPVNVLPNRYIVCTEGIDQE